MYFHYYFIHRIGKYNFLGNHKHFYQLWKPLSAHSIRSVIWFLQEYNWDMTILESPPQFENRIMARVYVRSITRKTMYRNRSILLAGTGVRKISSVACGLKSIILIIWKV